KNWDQLIEKRTVTSNKEKETGNHHHDNRDREIGTSETLTQTIGDDATQKRREQTRDDGDQSKDRHAYVWTLIPIAQISWHPNPQATSYKSHQCLRNAIDDIRARAKEPQVIREAAAP